MNDTSDPISHSLLAAPYSLNIWLGLFLCTAGNIGCIGNIVVFYSPTFQKRAYSIYLLFEAMSNIIYFDFLLLTRILQRGFQIPVTTRFEILCKVRQFVSVWSHQVSFTLFSFAIIDRLLSTQSSDHYRRWSNRVTLAYKMSIGCAFFWLLILGHRLILYSIRNENCCPLPGIYAYIDNYTEVVITALCTPMVMIILVYLLIRNVRDVLRRQIVPCYVKPPISSFNRSLLQQMDSRLTFMLILQSIIATMTYIPYAFELIYSNVTRNWPKSPLRLAQEKVFIEITRLLSYSFFVSSFYVSFISNVGFRRHIKYLFKKPIDTDTEIGPRTIFYTNIILNLQPK